MASSIMESLFQRTLDDLIKGLRVQMIGESNYLNKAMEEIRREIKSTDPQTKSIAVQKLTYLNMLQGLDMNWAAFHVIEVMSMPKFSYKKIGYLAASQSFSEETEVLLLITNQLRKDLTSTNEFEVGLALEFLSVVGTCDLARDLTPEIFTLLGSSKIFVKKKAIAVVLRVFSKYPDAVRVLFKRLVENLESSDLQAGSAVIGVFCELTLKDPRSYLPLAPEFYRILADSRNNWVLIKVLKIFAALAPLEPRLAKRIVEPVCEIMRRTAAKSLLFECVRTVVSSLTDYDSAVQLAVEKIRELLSEEDPNLKYLGLQALLILMPKNSSPVIDNKEIIVKSLSDADPNIQLEALNLVMGMVSESNVTEISQVLMHYALKSNPEFCNKILGAILSTCSRNLYELIVDFDWYVMLLGEISRITHCRHGEEIEQQLIDIGLRVKDVRPELVQVSRSLLIDPALLGNPFLHRILSAAAWISGEFVEFSKNPFELMEALVQPRTDLLSSSVRAVYIHSAFKVLVFCFHSYLIQNDESPSRQKSIESTLNLERDPASLEASKMVKFVEIETETARNASPFDDLAAETSHLASVRQYPEGSDLAKCNVSAKTEDGEVIISNPTSGLQEPSKSAADFYIYGEHGIHLNKMSSSVHMESCTNQSILYLVNLIKTGIGPLLGSEVVEEQERARNVLGLVHVLQEIPGSLLETKGTFNSQFLGEQNDPKASEIIELMCEIFSEELGPVSLNAQERVLVPDGLVLEENLANLATILGDDLPLLSTFSIGSHEHREWDDISCINLQSNEESEPSSESTSLLAQHRKKHGLYYLPAEKDEIKSNDYPSANVSHLPVDLVDATKDLVKLTDQSLVSKRPNRAKPRPVVVTLDEGDTAVVKTVKPVKDSKDDLFSGAIRDILLGEESKPSSSNINLNKKMEDEGMSPMDSKSRRDPSNKSSRRAKKVIDESLVDTEKPRHGSSSSRRKKHHGHDKGGHRNTQENETERYNLENSQNSGCHRTRQKSRQRADSPLNVAPERPVIQDFLL